MSPRPATTVLAGVCAAALFGALGCSPSSDATDSPEHHAGALITAHPIETAAALPSAARTDLVTYLSENARGDQILVSGTVAIPRGEAPEQGWPVLSWAHGTTGVGDACAPSADTAHGPAHDYLSRVDAMLDQWVDDGYVVVRTDYEGLGTPGGHPYMNGESAANTVVDIVRAARQLDPAVGNSWIAMGHSQGGHAALYTASLGSERAPELELQGAVAYAPGSRTSRTAEYFVAGGPQVAPALSFLPVLLLGAEAAEPRLVADEMVTDASRPLFAAARTGCMDAIRAAAATVPTDQLFAPGADVAALTEYFANQEPEALTLSVPTLVVQGTDDVLVSRPITDEVTKALCDNGSPLAYQVYEGADHRAVLDDAQDDVRHFVDGVRSGTSPTLDCNNPA